MSRAEHRKRPEDGLQPERTALSWSRTSFGVLGNGALLLLRDSFQFSGSLRLLPALLAGLVALLTFGIGMQRQRTLRMRPLPARISARRQIQVIGWSVIVLIVVTALTLPI